MIVETYLISATDADVLEAPSRLASIPSGGTLILEFQADTSDATNWFDLTIQLPNSTTPLKDVRIPGNVTYGIGSWNMDDKYQVAFPVSVGGHVYVSLTLTGSATCMIRATLTP